MKERETAQQEEIRERFIQAAETFHKTLTAHDTAGEALHNEKRSLWISLSTENYIRKNAREYGLSTENEEAIVVLYDTKINTGNEAKQQQEKETQKAESNLQAENRELEAEQMMWQLLARANTETPFSEERIEAVRKIVTAMLVLIEHQESVEKEEGAKSKRIDIIIKELGRLGTVMAQEDDRNVGKLIKKMGRDNFRDIAEKISDAYDAKTDPAFKKAYLETVAVKVIDNLGVKRKK